MWSGVFQTKNFEGSAETRRAQLNVAVKTMRFNTIAVLSSLLYFLHYIAVVSRLKSVLVRKSSRKFIRVAFYFLMVLPGFTETLLQNCHLKGSFYKCLLMQR